MGWGLIPQVACVLGAPLYPAIFVDQTVSNEIIVFTNTIVVEMHYCTGRKTNERLRGNGH
jgi:hypothetical protein